MDAFYERLLTRTATIDELLSDDFESLPGEKRDADLAARRLAAWCRSCASGDWALFGRRLARDGLSFNELLTRFATVRRKTSAPTPIWFDDAIWIEQALNGSNEPQDPHSQRAQPYAFEQLFTGAVQKAEQLLWSELDSAASANLLESARNSLSLSLLKKLSDLCTPAIYDRFCDFRNSNAVPPDRSEPIIVSNTARYHNFISEMRAGGFRRLFEDKPVLLRLIALTVRQWLETSRELVLRLRNDLSTIRTELTNATSTCRVERVEDGLSDPHRGGRSVQLVIFEDAKRVVYKPKDLRLDHCWECLITRLNADHAPIQLRAPRVIARDGYGWAEFIAHAGVASSKDYDQFFRRAGAWLALFHCFVATDMHQENLIASGSHPIPIDLEMLLQPSIAERSRDEPERDAFATATDILANSVMAAGMIPAYSRGVDNSVFAVGGLTPDWNATVALNWSNINSDDMRPFKSKQGGKINPNLPHVEGCYAALGDFIDEFVRGFEEYSTFLLHFAHEGRDQDLFRDFSGLWVRKVIRPTRFYYMLLQRLKDHRSMDDGVIWSAQADFIARLSDWEGASDSYWGLQQAERHALLSLNVPHFVVPSDGMTVSDTAGASLAVAGTSGLARAQARVHAFDEQEIAWQVEMIKENTRAIARPAKQKTHGPSEAVFCSAPPLAVTTDHFVAEANRIAGELTRLAIRRGSSAAWIGLDWLGDAEVFQLVCLGPTLYNGTSGISLFLAAHARAFGSENSRDLALAGVSHFRKNLRSRNAARMARSLGIGGAAGLGSIIYALTEMASRLSDETVLADAQVAAELLTDELIAADKQLDVIGGSAGAILALLRLYRDTRSDEILKRAQKCGEHLLVEARREAQGGRSWVGQGLGSQRLTGISHGAAGFAYALASLFAATGHEEFAQAASDCIAFEDSAYDLRRHNWPDFRSRGEPAWPCQWCHGAVGIGLARLGSFKRGGMNAERLLVDIRRAVDGAMQASPSPVDTLCCGTLGIVEFFCEAAGVLQCDDLQHLALQRLQSMIEMARHAGDYRWNSGTEKFNLGLFRGLSGLGYTLLRQVDRSLPNVLIWD